MLVAARNLATLPLRGGAREERGLNGGTKNMKDAERIAAPLAMSA